MQGSQHDDPSRDARQLPSGVMLSRETGNLRSVPSRATTPLPLTISRYSAVLKTSTGSTRSARRAGR